MRLEVQVVSPLLARGLVIVDAPGVNDADAQTARAERAVAQADLVLFVLNATRILAMGERRLAAGWMARGLCKPVVPVLNFMNLVEEDDRPAVREILDQWADEHLSCSLGRAYFEVNALGALRRALNIPENHPPDDFEELRDAFTALLPGPGRRLARTSRTGQLRFTAGAAARWNTELLEGLCRDGDQVRAGRESERGRLASAHARCARGTARERAHALSRAAEYFDEGLAGLIARYQGQSRATLEALARQWFDSELLEAARGAEHAVENALSAISGMTSGVGLASAITMGSRPIRLSISGLSTPPAERPTKMSAPSITSASVRALVSCA